MSDATYTAHAQFDPHRTRKRGEFTPRKTESASVFTKQINKSNHNNVIAYAFIHASQCDVHNH